MAGMGFDVEEVPLERLILHPANPRDGDVGAIVESIRSNGWASAVVAQRSTRHVLAGNHRIRAARECGIGAVPVLWLDVDDDTALRILLADNRTSDLATWDDRALADLLVELRTQTEKGLTGTGFDGNALDELLADLLAPSGFLPEDGSANPQLDEKKPTVCPECGHEWTP